MPRRIEVDIVGDASSLQRTFRQTAEGTKKFEREMSSSLGRVNVGFKGLARTATAFVGITGVAAAFRTVVGAAVDAQVSQKQLAAQMKASGESFKANQAAIEKAGLSLGRFGFTIEDSEKALTVLDRGTKNITRSIQLQGVAANLARAKNIDLSAAAGILAKVFGGQETALRRAVPGLEKHAHGLALIAEASRRVAGQAGAGTTAEERFRAVLHNTEVVIGTALLPTVNRLLDRLSVWLDRMNRSGRLQRDVNEAVKVGTEFVNVLSGAFKDLSKMVGGSKHALELLIAAFVAFKALKLVETITNIATAITNIGTAAEGSTAKVDLLRKSLGGLGVLGLAAADLYLGHKALTTQATAGDVSGAAGSPYPKGTELDAVYQAARRGKITGTLALGGGGTTPLKGLTGGLLQAQLQGYQQYLGRFFGGITKTVAGFGGPGTPTTAGTRGAVAQNTAWAQLQNELARDPNNLGLLRQRVAYDQGALKRLASLRAQHRITLKDFNTQYRNYWGDINSTLGTISGITTAAAKTAKAASSSGWQVPMGLQIAQARAGAFGTTADQNNVLRRIKESAMKALKSGKLVGQAWIDVYNTIAGVNQQLAQGANQFVIKYQRGLRGTQPAYAAAVGGMHVTIHTLNLHGVSNATQLENELEARAKRRPVTRRGR